MKWAIIAVALIVVLGGGGAGAWFFLLRGAAEPEQVATKTAEKGIPLADAAAEYQLPDAVADWVLFNPQYFEVAFKSWYEELS